MYHAHGPSWGGILDNMIVFLNCMSSTLRIRTSASGVLHAHYGVRSTNMQYYRPPLRSAIT